MACLLFSQNSLAFLTKDYTPPSIEQPWKSKVESGEVKLGTRAPVVPPSLPLPSNFPLGVCSHCDVPHCTSVFSSLTIKSSIRSSDLLSKDINGWKVLFSLVLSLKELHWGNEVIGSRRTWGVRGSFLFSWSHFMTVAVSIGCPLHNLGLGTMREGDTSNL